MQASIRAPPAFIDTNSFKIYTSCSSAITNHSDIRTSGQKTSNSLRDHLVDGRGRVQVVEPEILVSWNSAARIKSIRCGGATRLISDRTAVRLPLNLLLICCAKGSSVLQSDRFGMRFRIVHDIPKALV